VRQLLFRKNYYLGLMKLSPEKRLEAYDAIMKYAFDGEVVETSAECAPLLASVFESINLDFERYKKGS
jgi:hypothetical protein